MLNPGNRSNFVELDRTFNELSQSNSDSDETDLSRAFTVGRPLSWSDLLKEYRVVLLSEAGSGKTEEIRNVAQKLRDEGKAAFFLRLEHIPSDFEDAFEVGSFDQFEDWLESGAEGWLLLDSVDEARLRSPSDFELAVRKLGKRISSAWDRTHVLITGRTSAWRPKSDLILCNRHLPIASSVKTLAGREESAKSDPPESVRTVQQDRQGDSTFKIFGLDDLSEVQVRIFANARGVSDTAPFLRAVERTDAWSFTTRPQDLEELVEFWIEKGRIGSRLDLMQNSIVRRLRERDQNRADTRSLPLEAARDGARLLAAAATLGHESIIRVPDGNDGSKGILIDEVLPDWPEADQATLLSRPIFDEAIYGTVRFHHRSVREYLTAEWLSELLNRETSRAKIEALFFRNQYGLDVVVPTLRPVLPWLAIFDTKVRERLCKITPEIVFEGGDPSQLPLETRRRVLYEVCERMADDKSTRSAVGYDAALRFADVDLADDIRNLIRNYNGNDELLSFLLRMVRLGELSEVLPEAKTVALSDSLSTYPRIAAIRAVAVIGSDEDLEEVRQAFLKEAPELSREWLAELVEGSRPSEATIKWLLAALAKSTRKERFRPDHLTKAVEDFVQAADLALLPQIAFGLNDLLDQEPSIERRYCKVSKRFSWLLKAGMQAVARLIKNRHPSALKHPALSILRKCRAARAYQIEDFESLKADMATLVREWPMLNRALFWNDVNEARENIAEYNKGPFDEVWRVSLYDSYWKFNPEDFDYVINQIRDQPFIDNRLMALSLAFDLYIGNGKPAKWLEKLKERASGDRALSSRLHEYLNPPPSDNNDSEKLWKRRHERQKRKNQKGREVWRNYLIDNVSDIRNADCNDCGKISKYQHYLQVQMHERVDNLNRWTDGEWESLIDEFGESVARAFRDGAVAFWRRYKPTLRSEGAPPNTTPASVIFGLTGISIEQRESLDWWRDLSDEEVYLACRYASYELNGFPVWFYQLFSEHKKIVCDFLLNEIRYELSIEEPEVETHYILSDVSWSGEWAWDQLAPRLMEVLSIMEPENLINTCKILRIIHGSSVTDDAISTLAEKKCATVRDKDKRAVWCSVWTGVDPDAAIPRLTAWLQAMSNSEDCTELAMHYLVNLLGGRRDRCAPARGAFQTPQHLMSLYLLMHEHIRRRDDIDRVGGGAYSPGLRDHAQEARNNLLGLLKEIPGKEAFLALAEISRRHPEESARPWFVVHARTKAEEDADIEPWLPSQVRDFQDNLERTPANHRELAELAVLRLLDLKADLENGDSSTAKILQNVKCETEVRKFIGHSLREKAFGRYSIPQEEELADAKRIDVRFLGCGFDGPVPVELKLADNWGGPKLFERLRNQLCGDYLRDRRSTRGIFVLVYRGEKAGWGTPYGAGRLDFTELVMGLQSYWEQISPEFPNVDEITVIGIDLTERSSKPSIFYQPATI